MKQYNHFEYCERLARGLKLISHTDDECKFFRATEQTELEELVENISLAHGCIMISIDSFSGKYQYKQDDNLISAPMYGILILEETKSTDTDTIFSAMNKCRTIVNQIIARIAQDSRDYAHRASLIDLDSIEVEGIGPVADLFYGIYMTYNVLEGIEHTLNKKYWNEIDG